MRDHERYRLHLDADSGEHPTGQWNASGVLHAHRKLGTLGFSVAVGDTVDWRLGVVGHLAGAPGGPCPTDKSLTSVDAWVDICRDGYRTGHHHRSGGPFWVYFAVGVVVSGALLLVRAPTLAPHVGHDGW